MNQILIGTCIPGKYALDWIPPMLSAGFETVAVNFHMSLGEVNLAQQGPRVRAMLEEKGLSVSTLGYYCNALQYEEHKKTLEQAIDCAALYGAQRVGTFAGALEGRSVPESMPVFARVFSDLAKRAEDKGLKLVIENCPMGGSWQRATCNIGFHPKAWDMMFDAVPSPALGLEWEPGHQMIQLIDPLPQLKQWVNKIYHMHGKDASIDLHAVATEGVLLGDGNFAPQRTPGFGDTDWRKVFSLLRQAGYEGDICVEGYHDPVYKGEWEMTAQLHALSYLKWCRGGDYTPNPW